jgi:tetratricopeptide (TPR) repeat protein
MSNENLTLKEAFDLAVQNHQNNNLQDAQNYYQKVLELDPNYADAHNNLGVIFEKLREYQKAKSCYEKVIKIDPNYVKAHNNLGVIFEKLREYQKAKSCYEKVIKIDPNYVNAHNNLGVIFKELGENQKAKEWYKKAIEIDPNYAVAHYNLGVIYKELGENQKAKDCFEKVISVNPNYAVAHYNLGVIFRELGEYQKAKECFEKAIELNPNYVNAYNNLGVAFKELKEYQKAKECFEKAIELNPNYADAHKNLGILLKQKRLLSKIEQAKKSEIKTSIGFFKKNHKNLYKSDIRLTSNPFISNRKVEAELISQLYKINAKKLDDVDPGYLRYGNGKSSDYELFENNFSTIKTVEKDLINIMKKTVKSDIFIMESFFNIFQTGSGIISHNHIVNFDVTHGLPDQKFSLTYYLDIGDQSCDEPGVLKLQDPDREILPSEGMIVIFPASRNHSATYGGKKDRVMIGVNFYSLI